MSNTATGNQAPVLPQGVSVANPWIRLGSYFLEGLLMAVTLYIGWMIWACMTASTGQTPAKRLLKLRVIDANTLKPASFGKMFWQKAAPKYEPMKAMALPHPVPPMAKMSGLLSGQVSLVAMIFQAKKSGRWICRKSMAHSKSNSESTPPPFCMKTNFTKP